MAFDRFPPIPLHPAAIEPKRPQPSRRLRAFLIPGAATQAIFECGVAGPAEAELRAEVCPQPKISGLKQCEDEGDKENHNEDEE